MELGQSKFDIGQKVWLVHTRTKVEYQPCKKCKGQFKQLVKWPNGDSQEVLCEACRYHSPAGQSFEPRLTTKSEELWVTGTIWSVSCNIPSHWGMGNERKPREVMYSLKDMEWLDGRKPDGASSYAFHEEHMYASREEAQAYIDQHQVLVEEAA